MRGVDSQTAHVLAHLGSGRGLTPMEAFDRYGITRLSGLVFSLRRRGWRIETVPRTGKRGQRYAEYFLRDSGGGKGAE